MYPGTKFKWVDQSDIPPIREIVNTEYKPLFCTALASEKGPEEWTVVSGQEFFDLYGTPNYAKFGQVSIQAGKIIQAGANLFVKRVVAPDAAMANLAIYAKVDIADGNKATVSFIGKSFENIRSTNINACVNAAKEYLTTLQETEYDSEIYLMWVFTDNGRGESSKRIKIDCNYSLSKTSIYPIYKISVIDNGTTVASYPFSLEPYRVADNVNISLEGVIDRKCNFIRCYQNDEGLDAFINSVQKITAVDNINDYDILNGVTSYGTTWANETVVTTSESDDSIIDMGSSIGLALKNGSDGCFKVTPLSTEVVDSTDINGNAITVVPYSAYTDELVKAFDGTFSPEIFNLDRYKIECIFDADYPKSVKDTISKLADFREDFMFFRDIGFGSDNLGMITLKATEAKNSGAASKFNALYCQTYEVRDPYSLKKVSVTILYTLAYKLVELLQEGHHNPLAGIRNGMIIDDIIPGSLNFNPVVTPETDQKETLDDNRINFASYVDDRLVIETEYTAQPAFTQLSYINNILLIQHVIREIRTLCPQIRYSFITENDLDVYENDVNEIIKEYRSYFNTIEFQYMKDEAYENNKIFYAVIRAAFNNFIQSEYFEVIAISTTSSSSSTEEESEEEG